MIAQKEWDLKPDSPPRWTDEAKGWRPGRDEANVAEPKEEDSSEDSSVEEPEVAPDSVGSSGVCVERVPGDLHGGTGSSGVCIEERVPGNVSSGAGLSGVCAEAKSKEDVYIGRKPCKASVSAAAAPVSMSTMEGSEETGDVNIVAPEGNQKEEEKKVRSLIEQTVASERAAAERLVEEEQKAAEFAHENAQAEADDERKTKNRFTQRSSPNKITHDGSLTTVFEENESKDTVAESKPYGETEDVYKPSWWDDQGLETIRDDPMTRGFESVNRREALSEIQLAAMSPGLQKQAVGDYLNTLLEDSGYSKWQIDMGIGCFLSLDNPVALDLAKNMPSLRWCMYRLVGGPLGAADDVGPAALASESKFREPTQSRIRRGVRAGDAEVDDGREEVRALKKAASISAKVKAQRYFDLLKEIQKKFDEKLQTIRSKVRELAKMVNEAREAALAAKATRSETVELPIPPDRSLEDPRSYLPLGGGPAEDVPWRKSCRRPAARSSTVV